MKIVLIFQFVFLICKSQNNNFLNKELEFGLFVNTDFLLLNNKKDKHFYKDYKIVDSIYIEKGEIFLIPKKVYLNPIDTLKRIRTIKVDSKGQASWTDYFRDSTLELKYINKHPKKEDKFTDKHYIEYFVANKPYPLFKPLLEKGICYYKSIKNPANKIRVFSLNPKDTIVSNYPDRIGRKGNYSDRYYPSIHYEKDTTLIYLGMVIPCYKFVGRAANWNYENCYDKITLFYEKSSLLPIASFIDTYEYNEAKNPDLKQFVNDILVKKQIIFPTKIR